MNNIRVSYDTDGYPVFFKKEKVGRQTLYMEFNVWERDSTDIYINVYASVYHKRKQEIANYSKFEITGENPVADAIWGIKAFKELESYVIDYYKHYTIHICVFATNSRRRKAYDKILSRLGYKYDRILGYNGFHKKV